MESFYALKPCWFSWDKYYKIYLSDNKLYGAFLAGQVYDEKLAMTQLIAPAQFFAPLAHLFANRLIHKRQEREDMYDALDLTNCDFPDKSRHNFEIPGNSILDVEIDRKKKSLWIANTAISGILIIRLTDGNQMKLIVSADQDIEKISDLLKEKLGTVANGGAAIYLR